MAMNVMSLDQLRGMSTQRLWWDSNPCPHQLEAYPGKEVAAIFERRIALVNVDIIALC